MRHAACLMHELRLKLRERKGYNTNRYLMTIFLTAYIMLLWSIPINVLAFALNCGELITESIHYSN